MQKFKQNREHLWHRSLNRVPFKSQPNATLPVSASIFAAVCVSCVFPRCCCYFTFTGAYRRAKPIKVTPAQPPLTHIRLESI